MSPDGRSHMGRARRRTAPTKGEWTSSLVALRSGLLGRTNSVSPTNSCSESCRPNRFGGNLLAVQSSGADRWGRLGGRLGMVAM
jgi:hypothetical protein